MKKLLHLGAVVFLMLVAHDIKAQCNFEVTITPSNPILCPEETDTLSTQVYDSYQWFENSRIIEGATQRTYVVGQDDILKTFKVAVTKDGCTDTSKRVLVDGYVFLLPYIIETGDVGIYNPKKDALIECPEDTLILTLGNPYSVNVQWYNKLKPIPGANEQTYYVTKNGSYTACGAPAVCPNYIACEPIPINAFFENPTATITQLHDTLFASKAKQYQWLFFNRRIPGATSPYYVPKVRGSYKVTTIDKYNCTAVSDPYFYIPQSLNDVIAVSPNPVADILHVQIKAAGAKQIILSDLQGNRVMRSAVTANDQSIPLQNIHAGIYLVQVLNNKNQVIASTTIVTQ